jgi:hypothetical protein
MNRQKPSIAELHDTRRYEKIADVAHNEIIRFVQLHLKRLSWVTGAYWSLSAAALAFVILRCMRTGIPAMDAVPTVCLGMALAYVILVPIHEHAHAIAYRLAGAAEIRVRYNLGRLTAYCEAPGAVVSGGEFVLVCLAPFLTLNPILALLALMVSQGKPALLIAGGLLLHIGACSGDIALVNFVWKHRGRALFTYDDAGQQRSLMFRSVV